MAGKTIDEIQEMFGLDPEELEIDFNRLDVEWGVQNTLLDKYLKASAYCDKLAKKADERVKIIRSSLVLEVSKDPEDCLGKGQKATAVTIEAYYRTHEEHQEAKEELIEAEYIRDIIMGQKSKAYNRKSILEEATKLSLAGWFSAPMIPAELSDLVQKIEERKGDIANKMIREKVAENRTTRRARRSRSE